MSTGFSHIRAQEISVRRPQGMHSPADQKTIPTISQGHPWTKRHGTPENTLTNIALHSSENAPVMMMMMCGDGKEFPMLGRQGSVHRIRSVVVPRFANHGYRQACNNSLLLNAEKGTALLCAYDAIPCPLSISLSWAQSSAVSSDVLESKMCVV